MKIGIIMGGTSSEREISLMTGREFLANIDKSKYEILPIDIEETNDVTNRIKGLDFALLALHGGIGENGKIQSYLEMLGIPYSGSGVLSSALCMNKSLSKRLLASEGIKTADWITIKSIDEANRSKIQELGFPLVVKPNNGGSSVGTAIVHSEAELKVALLKAFEYDREVLLETYIKGEEITCCILNGRLLPVISIKPKSEFFDYRAKYEDDCSDEIIAGLPEEVFRKVEYAALKCYNIFDCRVYARVDIILCQGEPYVLEVNTLPGMTRNSLFPKSAKAAGISFGGLLEDIISCSLKEIR